MIAPVFFPFTYISPYQVKTVLTIFKTISFFPIMTATELNAVNKNRASSAVTPVLQHPERMMPVIRKADEYIQWAALHKGNEKNLKTLFKNESYFKNDAGIFSLKAQIEKTVPVSGRITEPAKKDDPLFQAMLFLRIAQTLDSEKGMIQEQFRTIQQTEKNLMATLNDNFENNEAPSLDDPDEYQEASENYLSDQRVRAWLAFLMNNNSFESFEHPPVFVTTSEAAFDYLVSFDKKSINALDIDNIKVHENNCAEKNNWQTGFYRLVHSAMEKGAGQIGRMTDSGDGCAVNARIRIYLLSRENAVHNILHRTYETIPVCLVQLNNKNT